MSHATNKAFAALQSRNFRLYFTGQCFSLTGAWMQRLALVWLVLELTGSGGKMGLVELVNQCPSFIVGVFAGIFLDRWHTIRILVAAQLCIMLHSLALAWLMISGNISYNAVLGLSFLLGIITAVDLPARQASITTFIDHPSQLQSALSLQSGSFNLARLAGPAIAGFIIKEGGVTACFVINAVAATGVLCAYCLMRPAQKKRAPASQPVFQALGDGVAYIRSVPPIRLCIVWNYFFCFFAMSYMVLLSLYMKEALGGDARHLGIMLGSVGLGALAGVFWLAAWVETVRLPLHIWRMQALMGLGLFGTVALPDWRLCVAWSALTGFACVSAMVANNTLIQALVDDDKRGRVVSIHVLGLLGFGPIGTYVAGKLADSTSVQVALTVCATAVFCIGLAHGLRQKVYDQHVPGILENKRTQ